MNRTTHCVYCFKSLHGSAIVRYEDGFAYCTKTNHVEEYENIVRCSHCGRINLIFVRCRSPLNDFDNKNKSSICDLPYKCIEYIHNFMNQ